MTEAQAWAAWFAAERDQQAREHQADLAAIAAWQQRQAAKDEQLKAVHSDLLRDVSDAIAALHARPFVEPTRDALLDMAVRHFRALHNALGDRL